jgi:hypothetical protein
MRTLLSVPVVLLPPRYRGRSQGADLVPAAILAGALQALGGVALLVLLYLLYSGARTKELAGVMLAKGADTDLHAMAGMGFSVTLEYLFRPQTLLLLYFIVEGVARVGAALASQEVIGTLPLYLVAWAHGWLVKKKEERALPPLAADQVERVTGAAHTLRIASCRPKEHWDHLMTVEYEDELLEVMSERPGTGARPYVYFLRPKPEGKVVRGLHHYRPDETPQKRE